MRPLLLCLLAAVLFTSPLRAFDYFFGPGGPHLKKGDVIALVGGEDMVVASEYGYLELLLTRALPDYHLRFRNLAWEGDTVFEQRRDLNFPSYEEQLDKIGATVVIAQFGQMESLLFLNGKFANDHFSKEARAALDAFRAAYGKLLERLQGGGKRRVAIILPIYFTRVSGSITSEDVALTFFARDSEKVASTMQMRVFDFRSATHGLEFHPNLWRDRFHLNEQGHFEFARSFTNESTARNYDSEKGWSPALEGFEYTTVGPRVTTNSQTLHRLIVAKNRLWFDYWRPQNWAFLAGDRTAQPSSRDHLDPSKRWFPPEREAFLPLIEAKEKEIDALATQLAQGK